MRIRHESFAHTAIAVALLLAISACARPSPAPGKFAVGGELNLARTQLTVYINGEQVVQGPLRLRQAFQPRPPAALSPPGQPEPDPFPLRGSYQNRPVEVECYRQPVSGDPVCDVALDGARIDTLMFGPHQRAGELPE